MDVRERLRDEWVRRRFTVILGTVGLLMTLGAAGILSGFGLFILMMIQMELLPIVGSALLLASSTAVFLACYLWITP
jgi:hypothetical protein